MTTYITSHVNGRPNAIRRRPVRTHTQGETGADTSQPERIAELQRRWEHIKRDLPPQLTRRHIGMISVGGVIGTGLFLGSADALLHGGPVGALLGYGAMGSVVYCLCVSVGEIISFLPNVGGVVGLADLYVDPALGFSLGWAAWYNWSVSLPAEITAATLVVRYWTERLSLNIFTGIFLAIAVGINCFPARVYGEMEYWFSCIKVLTIVTLILVGLVLDVIPRKEGGPIGSSYVIEQPFAKSYIGYTGAQGRFFGFCAVLMQAGFSYFGSEVPGIAAGEVINATINVPRALRLVWIRIFLFYMGGMVIIGLIVPSSDPDLTLSDRTGRSSPFVIALKRAGVKVLPDIVNLAILMSAWSAAASDVYISSRFLFFLARCHHAPAWLATLTRYQFLAKLTRHEHGPTTTTQTGEENELGTLHHMREDTVAPPFPVSASYNQLSANGSEADRLENVSLGSMDPPFPTPSTEHGTWPEYHGENSDPEIGRFSSSEETSIPTSRQTPASSGNFVLPLASVLVSSSVGLLAFLNDNGNSSAKSAKAFEWMANVTSVASLQSWAGMLFTYLRWYQGTRHAEKNGRPLPEIIKNTRHRGQPFLALYALVMCIVILLMNGWIANFHAGWHIANQTGIPPHQPQPDAPEPLPTFLSAYVPLPVFVLMTIAYKLVHQTRMIPIEEMSFDVKPVIIEDDPDQGSTRTRRNIFSRIWSAVIWSADERDYRRAQG